MQDIYTLWEFGTLTDAMHRGREGKMRFVAVIQIGRIHYWSTQDDFYLNVYNYIVQTQITPIYQYSDKEGKLAAQDQTHEAPSRGWPTQLGDLFLPFELATQFWSFFEHLVLI